MPAIKRFEEIEVWNRARTLSKEIWEISKEGSFARDFGLRNQINRSSGSVMDNIAEGFGRGGTREFINFLGIARASNSEVRSQLYRAFDRGHIHKETYVQLIESSLQIGRMINGFIKYLKNSKIKGQKFE